MLNRNEAHVVGITEEIVESVTVEPNNETSKPNNETIVHMVQSAANNV
jgi:hypothetical protein